MRILYIDIDCLRPDHMGCYGYQRNTTPNMDAVAKHAVRFDNCYVSDAPCLPSRTALWSGRCGFHTGVVDHGGIAAEPFREGLTRGFRDLFAATSWMSALRSIGIRTATVSTFGERHAAWHWYAGYNEIYNLGQKGEERADEITPIALDWIHRNSQYDNWFLHVHFWDLHTPARTPEHYGNPFSSEPLPEWITEEVRQNCWAGFGPHSAQEPNGYDIENEMWWLKYYPRQPMQLDSMNSVRKWIDGYDVSIRYTDEHVGQILNILADEGILDDTVIIISADHGENIGELNIWGDHQTADDLTCRVPLIVHWPSLTVSARVDDSLHYQYDWAATLIELVGSQVPPNWDGQPFTSTFLAGDELGRSYLVTSQNAWSCQRGVRFEDYICLRTYHDGYKLLEPLMLFNLTDDPHEQRNLANERLDLVNRAMGLLSEWNHAMALTSLQDVDPMLTVLREGGPFHTRHMLPFYLERLKTSGRIGHTERLIRLHPGEATGPMVLPS